MIVRELALYAHIPVIRRWFELQRHKNTYEGRIKINELRKEFRARGIATAMARKGK